MSFKSIIWLYHVLIFHLHWVNYIYNLSPTWISRFHLQNAVFPFSLLSSHPSIINSPDIQYNSQKNSLKGINICSVSSTSCNPWALDPPTFRQMISQRVAPQSSLHTLLLLGKSRLRQLQKRVMFDCYFIYRHDLEDKGSLTKTTFKEFPRNMLLASGTIPFCGRHLFNTHSHMTLTLDKSCEIFTSCCCKGSTEHHPKEMDTWKGFNLKNRNLSCFGSVIYSKEYMNDVLNQKRLGMCEFIIHQCHHLWKGWSQAETKTVGSVGLKRLFMKRVSLPPSFACHGI